MQNILDKADNTPGTTGELTAAEYNDHKNEMQQTVTTSGQNLSNLETPDQMSRAMFIYGTGAQSMQDAAPSANVIELTPVTGASGLVTPDAYSQMDGIIVRFSKAVSNTSNTVTVNFGQTGGTLLGAKPLKTSTGGNPEIGSVKGDVQIRFNIVSDWWEIVNISGVQFRTQSVVTDYVILDTDDIQLYVMQPNTASQYGKLNITLPTGANNTGKVFQFLHSNNEGICSILPEGAEQIIYRGEQLTELKLYSTHNKASLVWSIDAGAWVILELFSNISTGWINTNDWTNRELGSQIFNYDNKSAATDFTGQVIIEATSNNTWVVLSDSGGVGASGTLTCYNATGTGFATNNRQITASDGTTADVNEPSGSTKNNDSGVIHNFASNYKDGYERNFVISSDGTDNNVIDLGVSYQTIVGSLGYSVFQIDNNSYKFQTGLNGLNYLNDAGSPVQISSSDWYYYINNVFSI